MTTDELSPELEQVLREYQGTVQAAARRNGLHGHEIDEVIQDVRIRLWRSMASSEKIAALPSSYIYRTAMSAAVDYIRRDRRRREESLDLAAGIAATGGADPDTVLQRHEAGDRIERALLSLSEVRRPVVRMYLAGYGHWDIAGAFGWTEGKARNLLYRGLADLRAALSVANDEPGPEPA